MSGAKVLVADDDPLQRTKLGFLLRECGYIVVEASSGLEAWDILRQQPIRLLFTDWMMPGINGLELIRLIRGTDLGHYVYVILCTGKDSRGDLIEGIGAGADDFLVKPAHPDELRARLHAGERIIELEKKLAGEKEALAEAYHALSIAHEKIGSDLRAAAKLQTSLLPHPGRLQNLQYDWVFRPISQVAGDIFNVLPLDNQHVGFYQLDVSGHGVTAAMLSFSLSKALQTTPMRDSLVKRFTPEAPHYRISPPDEVVRELNRNFQNEGDMYFTIIYGVLNIASGCLQLTQAGHPNPILIRRKSAAIPLGDGGFPVGALPDMQFDLIEEKLMPGDRLLLCSDGVTECQGTYREQFGMNRVMDCLNRGGEQSLSELIRNLEESLLGWRESDEFDDDVSVLAMEWTPED